MTSDKVNWLKGFFHSGMVSVIIPTYNRAGLISDAINSVHIQNYRPIECIIVDDGSSDDTKEVVSVLYDTYVDNDFHIKYFYQNNQGACAARNYGTINSKGEFIQYLDSDDVLFSNKISDQVAFLLKHSENDAVFGDWEKGTINNSEKIKGKLEQDMINQFYGQKTIPNFCFLFRRSTIEKIGPWDNSLKRNQEVDFHLRGILSGCNYAYSPGFTGLWRDHNGDRIVTHSGALNALQFHEKWIRYFEVYGLFTRERKVTASNYLFWYAMDLNKKDQRKAVMYLMKAFELNPQMPEFNTTKMKILRSTIGKYLSICLWNYYSRIQNRSRLEVK